MRFLKILISFLVLASFSDLVAQEMHLTVYKGNDEIGTINATRKRIGDTVETYYVLSDVNFRVIWKYNRQTIMDVLYKDEILEKSVSETYLNDDLQEHATLWRTANRYHGFKLPKDSIRMEDGVLFSTAKLYFHEPLGIDTVYSETFLQYCQLESLGHGRYKLFLPGGRINYYTYRQSQLEEIFVDRTWFDLTFRVKP